MSDFHIFNYPLLVALAASALLLLVLSFFIKQTIIDYVLKTLFALVTTSFVVFSLLYGLSFQEIIVVILLLLAPAMFFFFDFGKKKKEENSSDI